MKKNDFSNQRTIKTKIVSVYGLPGEGKTFFRSFLSFFYKRIYSNVDFYQNGKKKNKTIKSMLDLNNIKFSNELGILIIDEGGINNNSRRSSTEKNLDFGKLAMLSRKKNINIVIIAQLERSSDVYYREMSTYTYEMTSYFIAKNYLMFEAKIKDRRGNLIITKKFDLMKFSKMFNYSYNTLDESLIS